MKESDASSRKKHLRDLGLEEDATDDQIEERFIELCRQWQQSGFSSDRLKKLAQEKIDSVTQAYRALLAKGETEAEPEMPQDPDEEGENGEPSSAESSTGNEGSKQSGESRPSDVDLAEISRQLADAIAARDEAVRKMTELENSANKYLELWQHALEQIGQFQKSAPLVIAAFAVALGLACYEGCKSRADWQRLSRDYDELHQRFEEQEQRNSAEKSKQSLTNSEIADGRSSYFASRDAGYTYRPGVPMDAYAPGVSPPY
jgi:outer membrane murein-binding lipoprotein Lpp